ncbi:AAA family ATPase [Acetivibrio cellulolyticus]|uniref:AAA family ATPase n=1 Tax=Acetivibrio cellulolyticus TaxID=35830 RepID=UPI0001E2F619|nr:response regulator [Acetivibrio cellulolyticus]
MEKIKVVIVDDTEETRNNVKTLISFEKRIEVIGEAENGEEAIFIVKESRPDIVLMDINMPVMDGIKATEEISLNVPETAVIIMSVQGESEYLRKAMTAGAKDFLNKPFSSDDLITTILKTYDIESQRRQRSNVTKVKEEVKSKIITVFSTKGGVGKTTLASNLAVSMARTTKKRVALVDLDLQFGDIAIMLNASVKNTISDIIKEINQLDGDVVEDYLVTHFSGVRLLPAPLKPEYAEYITASHVEKILNTLKDHYHYIIVDTSASFHETVLQALDMSDRILMLSTLDLPTIKNVKAGLDVMETLHYPKEKINIILNKASEQFGIKYKDFENTLKHQIWAYIPEDSQTVITSANKGFPFVMTRTETKVAKAVFNITNELVTDKQTPEKEKGTVKKLFGL